MSDSLRPHGPEPTRLLCPWDFPGKSTGVGCHFLLQGIFLTQGSNPGLLHCRQMLYRLNYQGSRRLRELPLLLLLSRFSRVRLCATPQTAAHQAPPSLGFSRQGHWSGLPFPSPMHESEKGKWSRSVLSWGIDLKLFRKAHSPARWPQVGRALASLLASSTCLGIMLLLAEPPLPMDQPGLQAILNPVLAFGLPMLLPSWNDLFLPNSDAFSYLEVVLRLLQCPVLRLHAPNAGVTGLFSVLGTKISHATRPEKKKKLLNSFIEALGALLCNPMLHCAYFF